MDPAHERNTVLSTLQASVSRLEQAMNIRLIPPEGASFGYALRGARDAGGVAAVSGGIQEDAVKRVTAGPCAFERTSLFPHHPDCHEIRPGHAQRGPPPVFRRALHVFENNLFLECDILDVVSKTRGSAPWTGPLHPALPKRESLTRSFRKGMCAAESRIVLFRRRSDRRCEQYHYLLQPHLK